jgi:AraC-like DNA-binding protein
MTSQPRQVEQDSRGILNPAVMMRRVRLNRYPAEGALAGLIEWFWAVSWDLPDSVTHRQQVLTHPGANLSVGNADGAEGSASPTAGVPPKAGLSPGTGVSPRTGVRADTIVADCHGVATRLSTRALVGVGWTVAALTTPGGLGAFTTAPVSAFTDRVVSLSEAIKVDEPRLLRDAIGNPDEPARVALLAQALRDALNPDRAEPARRVAAVAQLAKSDRRIRTLTDLAEAAGVGPRTLQRQFREYAGVSPTWVLRRYRLLEAAESARDGEQVVWSEVAAALGYADQAHLIRDFRAAIGRTPAAYAQQQPGGAS